MENYSTVSSWDMARTQFGLKQGQEIFMAGCHLGAEIGQARLLLRDGEPEQVVGICSERICSLSKKL